MKQEAEAGRDWLGLQERVCVVTGAGSGIGAAIAESLVAAGAQVALLDRQAEAAQGVATRIDPTGRHTLVVPCDVSDMASVAQAASAVRQRFGPCHSLINNAGLLRAGPLQSVSLDDWNTVLAVNLTGYLLCAREFAPAMCEQGAGSIVNVASIAGQFPQTGSGAYSASKGGVLLLSRQMAVEWGPRGVRSNAVCPGMIRTALSARFYEEPGFEAKRAAVTASRRIGEPQDIADVVLFLASPRSAYVNGAELNVDGGMSSMLMDMVPRPGFNQTA